MASSSKQREGFRRGLSTRLHGFRQKFQRHSNDISSLKTHDVRPESISTLENDSHIQSAGSGVHESHLDQDSIHQATHGNSIGGVSRSSDLWSTAYREAIDSFGDEIDVAILMSSSVTHLFKELEEIDKDKAQESAFLRGVAYLHSIKVPLERFKLALDLASPLSKLNPTATTVVGVVSSVTAIAITFATADMLFAKQIGDMLEQISYIDDCDTLGQKSNRTDIHKTLVSVYQKILEFYKVSHEILTRRGVKLVMKMVLETDRLPNIIQDFLQRADILRKLVEKATWEIVEDIKAMLYDSEIARWLGSDKLILQSQYHIGLQALRNDEACGFLLEDPAFIDWYCASDCQWLAVIGDMGCGKTVTMAFLVDELSRRSEHQVPQPKTCYYYCRDDRAGQAVHLFSTLILSLLERLSGLKKTFFEWYKQSQASDIIEPAANPRRLGQFLEMVLENLDRPFFIVIDGLDECDRASRNAVLKLLTALSNKSTRLKIALSSRPEGEILEQLSRAARIDLSSDHYRDALIVRHTVSLRLYHLSEEIRALIIKVLSRWAQGSAIWVKMVVELIEVRGIRALGPMRIFLSEIPLPEQLSKVYAAMISRYSSDDAENKDIVTNALKLLAAAWRPLSIQELAWAVALAMARQDITTVAALGELVDHKRLVSLIHPFITRMTSSDIEKRQVGLVHQSVKEFVLKEWPRLQQSPDSTAVARKDGYQQSESIETFMLDVCVDYLLLDEIGSYHLFSEEQAAIEELPQEIDLFDDMDSSAYDPNCTWEVWEENMIRYNPSERGFGHFFVYAASHWITHFGAIDSKSLPNLAKIESLCSAGSIRLGNWIKQNCRPDCAVKARFEFDSRLYDPLSITSLYGSEAMLRDMLENSNFNDQKYLPSPIFNAADQILQWGDLSRLKIFFSESKFNHQTQTLGFFRLIIRQWSTARWRHDDWNTAFELVDYALDTMTLEQWGHDLLCIAARAGCMPVIQRLLDSAQHRAELQTELLRGVRSIGEAVLGNHIEVVECLLDREGFEAHLQHVNSRGENVLHLASKACNAAMFRLLVPRMQETMHQTDHEGNTVLVRIIESHLPSDARCESARILLLSQPNGIWYRDHEGNHHDPLQLAINLGDTGMCRILLHDGRMDPQAYVTQDERGELILRNRCEKNEEAIVELLRMYALQDRP